MRLRRTSPRNDKIASHPELDSGSHKRSKKSFDGEIAYQVRYDRTKNNEDIDMVMKSNYRVLSIAALAGVASLGVCSTAHSADMAEIPTPESINIALPTPTHGDNAGYTLTEISNKTNSSITLYEVINNEIKPHYYEYSIKDGASVGEFRNQDGGQTTGDSNLNRDFVDNTYGVYYSYRPANSTKGDYIGNGNAVYLKGYDSTIGSIEGNFYKNGTALYVDKDASYIKGNFYDNGQAIYHGAAMYSGPSTGTIGAIASSNFINNGISAELYKDSLSEDDFAQIKSFMNYKEVSPNFTPIEMEIFSMAHAGQMGGGAIFDYGYLMNVKDSYFANNHTPLNGGAIHNGSAVDEYIGLIVSGQSTGSLDYSGDGYAQNSEPAYSFGVVNMTITDDDGSILGSGYAVKLSIKDGNETINQYASIAQVEELVEGGLLPQLEMLGGYKLEETTDLTLHWSELDPNSNTKPTEEQISTMLASEEINLRDLGFTVVDMPDRFGTLILENTSFYNNYAGGIQGVNSRGGAVYSAGDLTVRAMNGKDVVFKGNYTINDGVKESNAIHMASRLNLIAFESGGYPEALWAVKPSTLKLSATNGGRMFIYDKITGENGALYLKPQEEITEIKNKYPDNATLLEHMNELYNYKDEHYKVHFLGDDTGHIYLLNNLENDPEVSLRKTNLHLGRENVLDGSRLSLHSGNLYTINNQIGTMNLGSLSVLGDTNMYVDVDLVKKQMDRPVVTTYGEHAGNINVAGINLLSDATEASTRVMFAEQGLKDNVTTSVSEVAYTPIYKYSVSYDKSGEEGYFVFARSGGDNKADSYNPAVLGSSSTTTVGALGTMNQTFNYAFQNSDNFMNIPYLERISMRDRNKYALSITGDATDMGRFSPLFQPNDESSSVWVKPYATFENVPLKNGPKVSNITYGTLVGFDSEMQSLKRGWDRVWTGYIGYNGASQRYSGIDSTQNGGLIGGTMTLYKGNFFNATTVSVGANVANNQTMYGSEDFAMLLSGIGNKTGYNFEFKEGKLILQPSMLMSYTFVNTFDYTNAAGVRIDNKPLHALQLAPGVKVIGNLKGGWQPYASVSMVWNLMGESDATANGVKLPEMSIKPYVQYGVGLQKRIKDHFMAYGQAMVQNGGRNGVSLTAGFRWALGHDCKYKNQKVDAKKQDKISSSNEILRSAQNDVGKKILKQMTPEQRAAYGGKYQNTSRTAKSGSLRQY